MRANSYRGILWIAQPGSIQLISGEEATRSRKNGEIESIPLDEKLFDCIDLLGP